MPKTVRFCSLVLAIGCSGPSEPGESFAALLSGTDQTYVLSIAEDQRTDPIITFDQQCAGVHRQHLLRDTIQLFANGTVRRAINWEIRANGEVVGGSYIPASGTWTSVSGFVPGSRVALQLTPPTGSSYSMPLRVTPEGLSINGGMGGVCSGSAYDGRSAEFIWTNR